MTFQNKRLVGILVFIAMLLFVPVIAMQYTKEVNWTLIDFVVAGFLLFGTGISCELVLRRVKKTRTRVAICGAILIALLIIWVELAVGIFG